jgi:epsilon-lactone hydrolase
MQPTAMANEDMALSVQAKTLPVPTADVSSGAQALIARPLNLDWNLRWTTAEEARAYAERRAAETLKMLPAMRERLKVTSIATTIDDVRVHILTPDKVPPPRTLTRC